jgi:polysaccharide biosynthesis/export protein
MVILVACCLALWLQAAPSQPAATEYVVGPKDVLAVTVFGEPDISGLFTVDSDGTFDFPWIGRVSGRDLTPRGIEEILTKRLADGYLVNPQVNVEVRQFRSQRVFVTGEVRQPGQYPLEGDMALMEVLALAGSLTSSAGSEVLVTRAEPDRAPGERAGPVAKGETIRVNVEDLQRGRSGPRVILRDGDTVFVPKADVFFVTGHVRSPGQYQLTGFLTLRQALSLAGGVSERGAINRVQIERTVDGEKRKFRGSLTEPIKPGDIIIVPQRFF